MVPRTIKVSYCRSYLIPGPKGFILVDTGNDSKAGRIINFLACEKISPDRIKLIVLTHVHFDHALGTAALKKLTGAKVIVHRSEAHLLEEGITPVPFGTTKFTKLIYALLTKVFPNIMKFPITSADILIDDELDLMQYGFDAKIIHTPGHTAGSISVVRIGKFAIVGDAVFGSIFKNIWPVFANDEPLLVQTWKRFLNLGIPVFYPGHGRKVRAGELRSYLSRMNLR